MNKKILNLESELTQIIEKYKKIIEMKKGIVKDLTKFLDNELEIKNQITDSYWTFESEVESLIKRIEAEGKNNNLISFFLENLKKGVK